MHKHVKQKHCFQPHAVLEVLMKRMELNKVEMFFFYINLCLLPPIDALKVPRSQMKLVEFNIQL